MSIREEINARIDEKRLFRLKPLNEKDNQKRTVLMSQEINQLIVGPWPDGPMGTRCARLRGDLESLVTAENITVCWDPFKARNEQIGRLAPVVTRFGTFDRKTPTLDFESSSALRKKMSSSRSHARPAQ